MSFQRMYQAKICTAEEAVQFVEPGEAIISPISPGEPPAF